MAAQALPSRGPPSGEYLLWLHNPHRAAFPKMRGYEYGCTTAAILGYPKWERVNKAS